MRIQIQKSIYHEIKTPEEAKKLLKENGVEAKIGTPQDKTDKNGRAYKGISVTISQVEGFKPKEGEGSYIRFLTAKNQARLWVMMYIEGKDSEHARVSVMGNNTDTGRVEIGGEDIFGKKTGGNIETPMYGTNKYKELENSKEYVKLQLPSANLTRTNSFALQNLIGFLLAGEGLCSVEQLETQRPKTEQSNTQKDVPKEEVPASSPDEIDLGNNVEHKEEYKGADSDEIPI